MTLLRRLLNRPGVRFAEDELCYVELPLDGRAVYVDQPTRVTSVCTWDEAGGFGLVRDDMGVRYLEVEPGRFPYPAGTAVDREWLEKRVDLPAGARQVVVGVATAEPPRFEVR
jgi:hypothetical protein